jgi:hypothetical protein
VPTRIFGNERRVSAEIRARIGMTQDEPLDKFLTRRIADGFFDRRGFAGSIAFLTAARSPESAGASATGAGASDDGADAGRTAACAFLA